MKLCRSGAGGVSLTFAMAVVLSINSSSAATNSWISPTSGNWQDFSSWSLGVPPGASQDIVITNAGWKAVEIGSATAANFLQSLAVDSITISSPTNTVNSLLLNYVGTGTPLTANSVTLNENSVLTLNSSSLQVSNLSIGGAFNQNNFSGVAAARMQVGDVGPGIYTMSNGTLAVTNMEVIGGWGHTAVFDQEGGYHYATPLRANAGGGEYDLHGGQLGGVVQMTGGVLNQYGGDLALTNFQVDGFYNQFGGTMEAPDGLSITGGSITQSGGTNTSGSFFAGSVTPGYDSDSGTYVISNGVLNVTGVTVNYRGTLDQEGGIININGGFSLPSNLIPPAPGFLVAGQFLKGGGMFSCDSFNFSGYIVQNGGTNAVLGTLTAGNLQGTYNLNGGLLSTSNTVIHYGSFAQNGGSHVVQNTLSVNINNFPYVMTGGQLTAPNIEINGSGFNHSGGVVSNSVLILNGGFWNEETAGVQLGRLQLNGSGSLGLLVDPNSLHQTNGPCIVRFADSSEQVWSNNATFTIGNWAGSPTGSGQSQVFFGANSSGLTSAQITNIQFQFDTGLLPAKILATGEIVPDTTATNVTSLHLSQQSSGAMQLNLSGPTGRNYEIDVSTDLVHWIPWQTQFNNAGTISVIDDTATNCPMRFYRMTLLP